MEPEATDPARPAFWDTRYASQRTPWDFAGIPRQLQEYLAATPPSGPVLIPGCGSGYEAAAFAEAGWEVTAVDFSLEAVRRARERVQGPRAPRIIAGDFFAQPFAAGEFAAVYERTFWCALPPARWPQIVGRITDWLKPGGELLGFFCFGERDDGPPFGLRPHEDTQLLQGSFELLEDRAVPDSLPLFAGRERWKRWRRV